MLNSLTSLRFFFAFAVFLSHLTFVKTNLNWYNWLKNNIFFEGYLGVSFFFILSGFVLALNYEERIIEKKNFNKKEFYIARFARIYPLHLLCLFIMLPYTVFNIWKNYFHWDIFFLNSLLLQSYAPIKAYYFSINNVSWSISTEFFFYLMFPFFIVWLERFPKLKYFLFLFIPIVFFFEPIFKTNSDLEKGFFYINPIVRSLDFILGIVIYKYYKKIKGLDFSFLKGTLLEFSSIICLILFFYFHNNIARAFRYGIYYWIPMGIIILIFSLQKGSLSRLLQHKIFVYLGEISFSFYMVHMIIIKYGNLYLTNLNDFAKIGLHLFLSLIASMIIFELYEKPLSKWIKKI